MLYKYIFLFIISFNFLFALDKNTVNNNDFNIKRLSILNEKDPYFHKDIDIKDKNLNINKNKNYEYKQYSIKNKDNLYIWLPVSLMDDNFENTVNFLKKELDNNDNNNKLINNNKFNNVILDLRGHWGGLITCFPPIATILSKNNTLKLENFTIDNNLETGYVSEKSFIINKKYNNLIILIDHETASSYEVLIYSLKRHEENNVTIIGVPSLGKVFGQSFVDNNTLATTSIITIDNFTPLFKIYPDIYYSNIDNIKNFNEIYQLIDNSLKYKSFENIDYKYWLKKSLIENSKLYDNNKTWSAPFSLENRLQLNNNILSEIAFNSIEEYRKYFFNEYKNNSLKYFQNKRNCQTLKECQEDYIKQIEIEGHFLIIWRQYFKNVITFIRKNPSEKNINYLRNTILREMYRTRNFNYLKYSKLQDMNDSDLLQSPLLNYVLMR